jgi:hypothetical protein
MKLCHCKLFCMHAASNFAKAVRRGREGHRHGHCGPHRLQHSITKVSAGPGCHRAALAGRLGSWKCCVRRPVSALARRGGNDGDPHLEASNPAPGPVLGQNAGHLPWQRNTPPLPPMTDCLVPMRRRCASSLITPWTSQNSRGSAQDVAMHLIATGRQRKLADHRSWINRWPASMAFERFKHACHGFTFSGKAAAMAGISSSLAVILWIVGQYATSRPTLRVL